MSLDMWFRDDIKNILIALNQANGAAAVRLAVQLEDLRDVQIYPVSHDSSMLHLAERGVAQRRAALQHATQDYRHGYCDALRAVAIAFGIAIPATSPEPLTENLRLTRTWKEVIDYDGMSGE